LIREDNQRAGKSWTWTYDKAGNISSKKEYAYTTGTLGTATSTKSYSYGNSNWGDLLTAYNGSTVSSDAIGNILSDGTWTYTWEHGRELATMSSGGTTWTFTYDADGMRTQRASSSATYNYVYNCSQLSQMTVDGNTLYFAYDASGTPLSATYNGTAYYYATNLQGDITAILNTSGTAVVTYTYDAWGKPLTISGSMASTLGTHNPLRYRGYVYDTETDLYYLQSRYYDSALGRFLNADAFAATGQGLLGYNMFAYCANNPVTRKDAAGMIHEPVGAGLQLEITVGNVTVGLEIICFWDVSECSDGGITIAVYLYGGVSMDVDNPLIGSILAMITDNSQLLLYGNEESLMLLATLLSNEFSVSVSAVLITGNEDFTSTESYEGSFTSVGAGLGKVKAAVAYSDTCVAYSVGAVIAGSPKILPSWGVSKTYYEQVLEFTLFSQTTTIARSAAGGRKSVLERVNLSY